MTTLHVRHRTVYRYARPVTFGEHRLMCRPHDSHDLRLLETSLTITPAAQVRWLHDVFGNSVAIATFSQMASELVFDSSFRAEHYPAKSHEQVLESYARKLPFSYAAEEVPDIGRAMERHYPDPQHRVDRWADALVAADPGQTPLELLTRMARTIKREFRYQGREEMGTQTPLETLNLGSGSCRDFALFMMEAARSLGMAARFVSGYLYDQKLLSAGAGMVGGGATHAWMQVYLPGAGWVEFDPTNALVGGLNLIRVAVARDAAQAAPLGGSFIGAPADYLGMRVEVQVATG